MSAIAGTRRSMKELADGTIRVQIDIDPIYRAQFFEIFSQIDMPVAIAPLVAEFEQNQSEHKPSEAGRTIDDKKPIGGALAKWAGMLCNDPMFWEWLTLDTAHLNFEITNNTQARMRVIEMCGIMSRAELDHDQEAANIFREEIMAKFDEWKQA